MDEPKKCPDCDCECDASWLRKHFMLASPNGEQKLLIRFPVLECPICKQHFETEETHRVVNEAIFDKIKSDLDKILTEINAETDPIIEAHTARIARISKRHYFLQGIVVGVISMTSLVSLATRHFVFGGLEMAAAIGLFTLAYFHSPFEKRKRR